MAAVWALLPLDLASVGDLSVDALIAEADSTAGKPQSTVRFNPAAFDVRLWNAPVAAADPIAADDQPPPPAPNLELIAIITENARCLAALYDTNSDRLHIAGAGERIGRLEIVEVDPRGVGLRDGSRSYRLSISPEPMVAPRKVALANSSEDGP